MSWTREKPILAGFTAVLGSSVLLFFLLEALSSIAYYQKNRPEGSAFSSTVRFAQYLTSAFFRDVFNAPQEPKNSKFEEVLRLAENHSSVYPNYFYTPQFHDPRGFYHLANASNSRIVDCNESGFYSTWESDEIGFRNPQGALRGVSDFLLLGDSFTEGACEQEENTIAGYLREAGFRVVNLGRGGSGPLHQLATLVEYGPYIEAANTFWIIFTGNDLNNLREEKTTLLANYLNPGFSQNLKPKSRAADSELRSFLDSMYKKNVSRIERGLEFPAIATYGETLDLIEANDVEADLLVEVAYRILEESEKQGKRLRIVVFNHYTYNYGIQDVTSSAIKEFSKKNKVPILEFSRDYLRRERENLYTINGPHFSGQGYRKIGEAIRQWFESENVLVSTIR